MKDRLLVIGATGSTGRRCVYFALLDPRCNSVTALTRSPPKDPSFYGFTQEHASLVKSKLHQCQVDYDNLEASRPQVEGHTAGISCLGVYSAAVKNTAEFEAREAVPNLAACKMAVQGGAKQWAYLSGAGARQPLASQTSAGYFQPMFSYVKGRIERDLGQVEGIVQMTAVRPGAILGRQEALPGYMKSMETALNGLGPWLRQTRFGIDVDDIAKAMVASILSTGHGIEVLENEQIKTRAQSYTR